jgi:hypothetical protein
MPWSVAFMVVAIVTITMIAKVVRERNRAMLRDAPVVDTASRDEIRQLKERIQVLERVITDERKSLDLDREIERLRDR